MILKAFIHTMPGTRSPYDIADIFRAHWREYQRRYGLSGRQWKVVLNIIQCRTAALGGFIEQCDTCGKLQIAYCSCRDRHCPKCGAWEKAQWLARQEKLLLPIPYFHIVFTTDHAINKLARGNQREVYDLLFHTAADTLQEYGQRYLAGELGITAVLHTWGQTLQEHIHLHTLVTGGALGKKDGQWKWSESQEEFLFPIVELSATFRDKFCAGLLKLYQEGRLELPGDMTAAELAAQVAELQAKKWEVYARVARGQEVDGGAEQVLDYFGRYTNRIAIANYRIVELQGRKVSCSYYDNKSGGEQKVLTLDAVEFIRRFLQHVLPKGYMRIRHYGLHHNRKRGALAMCRQLLGGSVQEPPEQKLTLESWLGEVMEEDPRKCPFCGKGRMEKYRPFGALQGIRALALRLLGLNMRGAAVR